MPTTIYENGEKIEVFSPEEVEEIEPDYTHKRDKKRDYESPELKAALCEHYVRKVNEKSFKCAKSAGYETFRTRVAMNNHIDSHCRSLDRCYKYNKK